MVQNRQFLFIIGAPRSGTTWLQAMIGAHSDVCTTAELMLFNHYTALWVNAWNDQMRLQREGSIIGLPTVWTEDEFYGFLREFLKQIYERVLALKPAATVILDKHPGYAQHVEHIHRLIPDARFIHMIRDGRDVAASMLAASRHWGRLWAPKNIWKAAASWKGHTLEARRANQYVGQYLEVRYEDLLTKGEPILESVFKFVGLPTDTETIAAIWEEHQFDKMKKQRTGASRFALPEGFFRQGRSGNWHNALSPMQRYLFHDTAGDLLIQLGYADQHWWSDRKHQSFIFPVLSLFLDRKRANKKLANAVKEIVGPAWVGRIRAAKSWVQRSNSKPIPENS
jgi:sulfotransferase family protein